MTFIQKLQAHKGGLVKINAKERGLWADGEAWAVLFSGRVGMIYDVDYLPGSTSAAWIDLFIDENVFSIFVYEDEVEFL